MIKPYRDQRVICKRTIAPYPHFVVPALSLGTVDSITASGIINVMMDEPEGCVQCGAADFFDAFDDLLVRQLESALSIIYESDNAHEHVEWIKGTCAVLRDAGSMHYAIEILASDRPSTEEGLICG